MYKIGNQGTFKALPDPALAIYQGDVARVEAYIQQGMDLEEK